MLRFLGEGATKTVYKAHDSLLERHVAVALIKTEGLDQVGRQRVLREAQTMARLGDHPNIVQIYDLGYENGQPYMILPLLTGGQVERLIQDGLTVERLIHVTKDVCRGLAFAHSKGIVHRDLKPANVWLAADGTAKIGDFGLAIALGRTRLTKQRTMVGTTWYVSPEQATGGEIDLRSDLYSLGCILYQMVTGRPPFLGDDPISIISQHVSTPPVAPTRRNPRCSRRLEVLILKLLSKDPAGRPGSATDTLRRLEVVDLNRSGSRAPYTSVSLSASRDLSLHRDREPAERRVTVLLVDDHDLLREGTKQLLERDPLIEVVGEATGSSDAISSIEELQPDVVILDISLREGNGIDVVKACRKVAPETKILMLSASDEDQYVRSFLRLGVRGYLVKTALATEVIKSVRDVAEGKLVFPAGIADKVVGILQAGGVEGD